MLPARGLNMNRWKTPGEVLTDADLFLTKLVFVHKAELTDLTKRKSIEVPKYDGAI